MTEKDGRPDGIPGAGDWDPPPASEALQNAATGWPAASSGNADERLADIRRRGRFIAAAFLLLLAAVLTVRLIWDADAALVAGGVGAVALFAVTAFLFIDLLQEDSKKAKRIRDRDLRYRQTLALLPEGVVILGEGWRIDWFNRQAMRHLGVGSADLGRSFLNFAKDEAFESWLSAQQFDAPCIRKAATGDRMLEVAAVAPDSRHTFIVTHDITERRRMDDMRRDFVANVSHELRTPLTVISGFLETEVETPGLPEELLSRHRALMVEQTRRMRQLLEDLLTLSGLENADDARDKESVVIAMPKLLEDVVREGETLSGGRHAFHSYAEDISLIGDPAEIRSAAMNLVSNAVRYTPEGGAITVSWKRDGTDAVFSVKDTGIGIEAKHIPRLTERFYRVDKGRSRATGGTGLGLAIVKHTLRRNGGTLVIESTPGKGSTFSMRFPEMRLFLPIG